VLGQIKRDFYSLSALLAGCKTCKCILFYSFIRIQQRKVSKFQKVLHRRPPMLKIGFLGAKPINLPS
jgi:hypothetical protein